MGFILPILGIVGSFFMLKYREYIGNMMGEAAWMSKVGGVYNVIVIVAIFIFFWSLAELTGTTDILFRPLLWFIPGLAPRGETDIFTN
jgi:hypothetical protein